MTNQHQTSASSYGHRPHSVEPGGRYAPLRPRAGLSFDVQRVQQLPRRQTVVQPVVQPAVAPADPPVSRPGRTVSTTKPALPRQNRSQVLRRQIIERAELHRTHVRKERRQQLKAFLFGGAVAAVFGGMLIGSVAFIKSRNTASIASTPVTATLGVNSAAPEEAPVTFGALAAYVVDEGKPRLLKISRLGIQARIGEVGAASSGEPAPTSNIFDVGWLNSSALPGEPGPNGTAALLNGHVAGATKAGAFSGLDRLQPGDLITIDRANQPTLRYKVVKTQRFPNGEVDLRIAFSSIDPAKPGLNLLTNKGKFDTKTNAFEDRMLVMAVAAD